MYTVFSSSTTTTNYSLETLMKNKLGCLYEAHDAVENCKYLQKLTQHRCILIQFHISASYIIDIIKHLERTKSNL